MLEKLISDINKLSVDKNTNLEIECRFSIDDRKKEKIYSKRYNHYDTIKIAKYIISKAINDKNIECSIEQSINFIRKDSAIKKILFNNGIQNKTYQHYQKNKLIHPVIFQSDNNYPSWTLMISEETKIEPFDIKETSLIRIKLRFTIILDKWNIDITLVKNVDNLSNSQELKVSKDAMLFNIDIDNFIEKAPWNITDTIEFELEYNKDHALFIYDDLKFANEFFESYIDDLYSGDAVNKDYQKILFDIGKKIKLDKLSKYKGKIDLKVIGNQPIELNKNIYLTDLQNNITNYYITDKVDGVRCIIYIDNGIYILTDKVEKIKSDIKECYLFDCEKYNDKYYIFDVMIWNNNVIIDRPFSERMKYFDNAVNLISGMLLMKPFIKLENNYIEQIKIFKQQDKKYNTDGFILTPQDGKYNDMIVYKYKPIDKMTIDFMIKKCPDILLGIEPYKQKENKTLYLLFCGISKFAANKLCMKPLKHYDKIFPKVSFGKDHYVPIQFEPSNKKYVYLFWDKRNNLDHEIGEFIWKKNEWHLERIREDRKQSALMGLSFGNNYKIAESIWYNYTAPLVIEELDNKDIYFQKHENELQKNTRNFNSFVKNQILEKYSDTEWCMDLASGKGQDLFRYGKFNIGKSGMLFIEIDKVAILELINRKHEYSISRDSGCMNILTQNLDLNDDYKDNIKKIEETMIMLPNNGFNLIVCNFALHYMLNDPDRVNNIIAFISHYLMPGGKFIFTAFDGKKIIDLLKKYNGHYKSKVLNKFSIIKKYKGDVLMNTGQKIDVLLPFSLDQHYEENLVNIEYLESVFKKYGIVLESNESFSNYIDEYNKRDILDKDDLEYINLYHVYVFHKSIKKAGRR